MANMLSSKRNHVANCVTKPGRATVSSWRGTAALMRGFTRFPVHKEKMLNAILDNEVTSITAHSIGSILPALY
jgi:hypothetical protein